MTFNEFVATYCANFANQAKIRDDLAWHLAQYRARKTYEACRSK